MLEASMPGEPSSRKNPAYTRREVLYGRKFGMALTMDVFTPERGSNGAAVIFVVSGGWYSHHARITPNIPVYVDPFVAVGYTVFAVCHGSSPKFCLPEIVADLHRAVRFIRHHAGQYGIHPERVGAIGDSAGGHLSLMLAVGGTAGDPAAADVVNREHSTIQAAVAFYPPTDFLNWGEPGKEMLGEHPLVALRGAFAFSRLDPATRAFELITDLPRRVEVAKTVSPVSHIHNQAAPILIVHGDADEFIPLQQAELMAAKLHAAGVPSELIVKKGGGHDEALVREHIPAALAWFEQHLLESGGGDVGSEVSFWQR